MLAGPEERHRAGAPEQLARIASHTAGRLGAGAAGPLGAGAAGPLAHACGALLVGNPLLPPPFDALADPLKRIFGLS